MPFQPLLGLFIFASISQDERLLIFLSRSFQHFAECWFVKAARRVLGRAAPPLFQMPMATAIDAGISMKARVYWRARRRHRRRQCRRATARSMSFSRRAGNARPMRATICCCRRAHYFRHFAAAGRADWTQAAHAGDRDTVSVKFSRRGWLAVKKCQARSQSHFLYRHVAALAGRHAILFRAA